MSGDVKTKYGVIHYGGPCRDDYPNMETYNQQGPHTILTLQRPAMKAFQEAERVYAKKIGWDAKRIRKNKGLGRPIAVLPGTNRSCATQASLYRQDPGRYARPEVTGHTRGFAIDVDQGQPNLAKVNSALLQVGWKRVRSDEPWHFTWGPVV